MSRAQFVRNTLATIQMQLQPNRSVQGSVTDLTHDDSSSVPGAPAEVADTAKKRTKRSDSITSWNSVTRDAVIANLGSSMVSTAAHGSGSTETPQLPNDSSASVSNASGAEAKTPNTLVSSVVYDRNWENDMESLLKVRRVPFSCWSMC